MPQPGLPRLTPTQWLVLERVARGESNLAIAAALGSVPGTIASHVQAVYGYLALGSERHKRAVAAAWYRAEGAAVRARLAAGPGADAVPPLKALPWRALALLAQGANDNAIAAVLGLTRTQVSYHLRVLYGRLPLGDATNRRAAAVVWYLRAGHTYHEEKKGDDEAFHRAYLAPRAVVPASGPGAGSGGA